MEYDPQGSFLKRLPIPDEDDAEVEFLSEDEPLEGRAGEEERNGGPPHREPTRRERGAGRLPAGFAALGVREPFLRALRHMGFEAPTPIQELAIPAALAGRDVVGQAKTGTGKTAAFALPALMKARAGDGQQALVLAPTRELALQVRDEFERLARYSRVRAAAIYGGASMPAQIRALREGREVLVGTPGRVLDLARRGELPLGRVETLVIDECDRMFDLGFRPQIERILAQARGRDQTMLFSATIGEDVLKLAERHMRSDAARLYTAPERLTVEGVRQRFLSVAPDRKRAALAELIRRERPSQAIVFVRTKSSCARLARWLEENGVPAAELHGDLEQCARERNLGRFRSGDARLLVATDVAARGLDIPAVSHVFNYDIPEAPEDYVHRIGRTARMGARGEAITLIEPGRGALLTEIEKLTNAQIEEMQLPGFDAGAVPPRARATGTGAILFSTWQPRGG